MPDVSAATGWREHSKRHGMTYLAIDIGGSGSRWTIGDARSCGHIGCGRGVEVAHTGLNVEMLIDDLCASVVGHDPHAAPQVIVMGLTGLLGLVADPLSPHRALRRQWPDVVTIVASDAVTGLAGAAGLTGGAVVAAGTGVVGLGTDFADIWHRVDGWGHLLGDDGGGAWIGMHGLRAALRWRDRRPGGSAVLAERARARFGPLAELPMRVYTRDDRARILASFAPDVVRAAHSSDTENSASEGGDEVARQILSDAGTQLAYTAIAAVSDDLPRRVSLVGGIAAASPLIVESFDAQLRAHGIRLVQASGTPLDGAVNLARAWLADPSSIRSYPPYIRKEEP
ncbi:MAG: BadF/BadG/BcrA/BcrD ATPase family protein [Gordonia sp. (in: high G+C Gram-positive bacteria)]